MFPVHYWDERFSTAIAERVLVDSGMRRSSRKQVVDKIAAVVILQGYLDYARGSGAMRTGDDPHGDDG